eukprot:UN34828
MGHTPGHPMATTPAQMSTTPGVHMSTTPGVHMSTTPGGVVYGYGYPTNTQPNAMQTTQTNTMQNTQANATQSRFPPPPVHYIPPPSKLQPTTSESVPLKDETHQYPSQQGPKIFSASNEKIKKEPEFIGPQLKSSTIITTLKPNQKIIIVNSNTQTKKNTDKGMNKNVKLSETVKIENKNKEPPK